MSMKDYQNQESHSTCVSEKDVTMQVQKKNNLSLALQDIKTGSVRRGRGDSNVLMKNKTSI